MPDPASDDPLRSVTVRGLARDLGQELEALAVLASEETNAALAEPTEEVEGALRAADVANLAACAVPELPRAHALQAAAAAHLAAGTAQALRALVEAGYAERNMDGDYTPYALRDARGAAWRARFAARQVDEFLWSG